MKGIPKTISTGADLFNCLALVQAGELKAADLERSIAALDAREFIEIPILEMSTDRKTVVIMGGGELEAGVAVDNTASTTINAVETAAAREALINGDTKTTLEGGGKSGIMGAGLNVETDAPEETPDNTPDTATVTLSRALPASATTLRVKSPVNPFEALGTSKDEIKAIREVLKKYE